MYMYKTIEETIKSKRGAQIPVTLIVPNSKKAGGLVVYVHGFKAERTEGGRFLSVAEELGTYGYYGIMMDQSGCGDSTEPFDLYCTDNSLDDIESCIEYMFANYDIDDKRLAMVGYSNGGRNTAIYVNKRDNRFKTVVLWAAAIMKSDEFKNFLIDPKDGHDLYQEALEKGYGNYYNSFDDSYLHLSLDFYKGIKNYNPVDCMKEFQGNVLICHGTSDETVSVDVSRDCWDSLTTNGATELLLIENANHGFGLWDNHMEQSKILTDSTISFLKKNV